ncbi:naringenin,2-oxoglutarate 3-dioxygenase [Citrus sinensis]|nr:naringenin,2-oxoglutarate 3-dioxygenase [Citrus sinensis]
MTRLARHFFALTPEEKLKIDISGGKKGGFIVSSHLQGDVVKDWREIVTYFSYPKQSWDYSRWPEKPEGWIEVTKEYSDGFMGLACKLLEKEAFSKACVDMDQKIVVSYYPKRPQPDLTLGLKHHMDPGTITLPLQDQVGGLHATRVNGKTWITVQPVEGAFVVNLGDHGHYISNRRFKNADHQAVVNSNSSRLSIATFQNPAQEATKPVMQEPIPFAEMYRRKMNKDVELARLKKLANKKQQQLPDSEKTKLMDTKPIKNIFA